MNKIKTIIITITLIFSIGCRVDAAGKGGYSQNDVRVKSGLTEQQIKNLLPKNMKQLSSTIYKIENSSRPINSHFLSSVVKLESGNGTSYSYRNRNNVGGIMGRNGLRKFASKEQSLYYMQDFLYRGYINRGRRNVWKIGSKYCVGGNWAYKVNRLSINSMRKSWEFR